MKQPSSTSYQRSIRPPNAEDLNKEVLDEFKYCPSIYPRDRVGPMNLSKMLTEKSINYPLTILRKILSVESYEEADFDFALKVHPASERQSGQHESLRQDYILSIQMSWRPRRDLESLRNLDRKVLKLTFSSSLKLAKCWNASKGKSSSTSDMIQVTYDFRTLKTLQIRQNKLALHLL